MSHRKIRISVTDYSRAEIKAMMPDKKKRLWRFTKGKSFNPEEWFEVLVSSTAYHFFDAIQGEVQEFEYPDPQGETWDRLWLASNKAELKRVTDWIKYRIKNGKFQ